MGVAGLAAQAGRGDVAMSAKLAAALGISADEMSQRSSKLFDSRRGSGLRGYFADRDAITALVADVDLDVLERACALASASVLPSVEAFIAQDKQLRDSSDGRVGLAHAIGSATRSWGAGKDAAVPATVEGAFATTFGKGTGDIIEFMPNVTSYNKKFSYIDPDYLETMLWFLTDFHDSVAEMTFWSLWGVPMIMATDPRNMTDEKSSIVLNKDALAVARDDALLLPTMEFRDAATGTEAWSRPMGNGDFAVVLFNSNFGGDDKTVSLALNNINGWPKGVSTATGRDLWAHESIGTISGQWSANLSSHSVSYVRLTPASSLA